MGSASIETCDVLLVDDDEDMRAVMALLLDEAGVSLRAVESGAQALAAMSAMSAPPSLVLMDIVMPEMSGIDIVRAMRRTPELAGIPVVVLSGNPAPLAGEEEIAVARWLTKPVAPRDLIDVVRSFGASHDGAAP